MTGTVDKGWGHKLPNINTVCLLDKNLGYYLYGLRVEKEFLDEVLSKAK